MGDGPREATAQLFNASIASRFSENTVAIDSAKGHQRIRIFSYWIRFLPHTYYNAREPHLDKRNFAGRGSKLSARRLIRSTRVGVRRNLTRELRIRRLFHVMTRGKVGGLAVFPSSRVPKEATSPSFPRAA